MSDTGPAGAGRKALSWFLLVIVVLNFAGLSLMLGWAPAQRLLDDHAMRDWPAVQGRITDGHVEFRHSPRIGKRSAWDGWCAGWSYVYEWQGASHSGVLGDTTPSTLAPGCFSYREGAQQALLRRPAGSTLPVRVDPATPWHASTQPAGLKAGDIAELLLASIPLDVMLWGWVAGLRARTRARKAAGAPPATP